MSHRNALTAQPRAFVRTGLHAVATLRLGAATRAPAFSITTCELTREGGSEKRYAECGGKLRGEQRALLRDDEVFEDGSRKQYAK